MFARTSTWSGSAEALQKWSDHAISTVKGFVEGLPGNAGVVFLIDRDSGTALTLTLWDSQAAAEATDQFAEPCVYRRRYWHRTGRAGPL
jgi:hypothetical protein